MVAKQRSRQLTIAVALYGLPRCSAVTFPSIEQQILAPLRRCGDRYGDDGASIRHLLLQLSSLRIICAGGNTEAGG